LIVCFFIIKDKERALGGGEPRQARARVKPTIVILNAVENLSVKDPSRLRMIENS
jgi:hypothetical protein